MKEYLAKITRSILQKMLGSPVMTWRDWQRLKEATRMVMLQLRRCIDETDPEDDLPMGEYRLYFKKYPEDIYIMEDSAVQKGLVSVSYLPRRILSIPEIVEHFFRESERLLGELRLLDKISGYKIDRRLEDFPENIIISWALKETQVLEY